MRIMGKSDVGKAREMNQDSFYISEENDKIKLFILADGMGGYKGGEIASKLAVVSAKNFITNNFEKIPKEKEEILKLISDAIEYANFIVYEKAKEIPEISDMGTTLDICLVYNNKVFIGHIGDSRVYRIRKNVIRKLTNDQSYVAQLVKEGKITKEEAYSHPRKNMLLKAVGCGTLVEPDVMYKGFMKDDILLMCSDGLTNMVSENEIYKIIRANTQKANEKLVLRANDNGGIDNVSVIIVEN